MMKKKYGDVFLNLIDYVAVVEIRRPPHNFFDSELIHDIAEAFTEMDENKECRAIVLAAQGDAFCAGGNFNVQNASSASVLAQKDGRNPLYTEAIRLYSCKKPIVGAINGPAVGGGLGLALVPDFRVACPEARFSANFVKLGFHPGFGLTHTLPQLIGQQKANLMFLTGRRIKGEQALEWGLADVLTSQDLVREEAINLAREIAGNAPLAILSVRATLRQRLNEKIIPQIEHESKEQTWQRETNDFKEGIRAVTERRPGNFQGN